MKTKSTALLFVFLAILATLLASLACYPGSSPKSDDGETSVQQTLIAIQLTQIALENQAPVTPEQPVEQEQADNPPPVEEVPQPEIVFEEQPDVVYEGISFSFDPAISGGIYPQTIPAQNKGEESFPGDNYPTHFELDFNGYAVPDHFHTPIIRVYPVDEFRTIDTYAGGMIDEIKQALITHPAGGSQGSLPFLPRWNAGQIFSSNVEYFDFQNGSGIRFLTMYGQALYPVDNTNLFYTYQGITQDGRYYISAILPVTHSGLPEEGQVDDFWAFEENWDNYIASTITWLEAQPTNSFNPNLELLDAMMASFKIDR